MTSRPIARGLFGLNCLVVIVGMIIQLWISAGLKGSQFHSRCANLQCLLLNAVGVGALWLALGTLARYVDRVLPPRVARVMPAQASS
jgi:hypothetical protein